MTQKIRAINIANNTFKSFVFDSTVSSLINVAAVAYSTANAANALVQAANTLVVSQTLQIANAAPTINTVSITDSSYNVLDDTAANTGGAYLRVTGSGFQSGAIVMVGTSNTALSTTFVDSNTLRAQIGAIASGTYPVYVVNTNGGTAIRVNALTVSSFPVWGTGSTLANVTSNTVFSTSLSANSDSSITYSNTTILPTGTTLLSNGYFYGNVSVGIDTTYSFDVKATDTELQDQTRTFSLTSVVVNELLPPTTVEYLVVAGGAGGGSGSDRGNGGGGAGGYRTGTLSVTPGTPYTVTVGSGGASSSGGSISVFSTVTSAGGGAGASRGNPFSVGQSGGSGGGADHDLNTSVGFGNTPPTSPSQGNNGGQGYNSGNVNLNFGGGGGGGAGGVGGNANSSTSGRAGDGGVGATSSISGSTTYYAGGGGGGAQYGSSATGYGAGLGGTGGGGNGRTGGSSPGAGSATSGTVNTGGGGGGAHIGDGGGSGGSGVVILRYADTFSAANTTGGSTATVAGGYRIYTFTSSGSISWPSSSNKSFTISPTLSGKSTWDLGSDGAINITSGNYTLTALGTFSANVKMWGAGGNGGRDGSGGTYNSGAGAALTATVPFISGTNYYLSFFGAGTGSSTYNGNGGQASGIFLGSSAVHANSIAIAAGGGGGGYDDGGRNAHGGAGGYPTGQASSGWPSGTPGGGGTTAGGGTQSAGGTAGGGSNVGTAGSALQGGNGGSGGGYQGGGGGGGYYGGGGGGMQASWAGAGGGGGSSYTSPSYTSNVTHYSGSGTTAGNSPDTNRGGAGTGVTSGSPAGTTGSPARIYIAT